MIYRSDYAFYSLPNPTPSPALQKIFQKSASFLFRLSFLISVTAMVENSSVLFAASRNLAVRSSFCFPGLAFLSTLIFQCCLALV